MLLCFCFGKTKGLMENVENYLTHRISKIIRNLSDVKHRNINLDS